MKASAATLLFCVGSATQMEANPIRRVVSMLQAMQKKIEEDGEVADKLFVQFQCYCQTNSKKLADSIEDAKNQIDDLTTNIQASESERTQLIADLNKAKEDRAAAQKSIEDATAQRKKEAKEFEEYSSDAKKNLAAMAKAIPAIEQGMGGSFLQTDGLGATIQKIMDNSNSLAYTDKTTVEAFLQASDSESYAPQGGEIVGILKQMEETMTKELGEATSNENDAIADFNELLASQNKAIQAATDSIEEKTEQSGQLAVEIVQLKNDRADTTKQLDADTGYSQQLEKDCEDKVREYGEVKKSRAEELLAIADTIKILNDDDALELFKKTGSSFLQLQTTARQMASDALQSIRSVQQKRHSPRLDLIALALQGKTGNFDKVVKEVDNMEGALQKEQKDDERKLEYCNNEFHATSEKLKDLAHTKEGLEQKISGLEDDIKDLEESISGLEQGIKDLDKAVAEATEQRKEEHEEYVSSTAQNQAAVDLLGFAKNRLQKFYNPKQYKAAPKRELTEEERIASAYGGDIGTTPAPGGIAGTGIGFVQIKALDAPPPPPEMGGHKKQQSGGVLGMIDMMVNDLKTEMNQARLEEEDSQADYEKLMQDSADKRAADAQTISEKEGQLAEANTDLSGVKDDHSANSKTTHETHEYEQDLHKACDYLQENFDARKTAREEETEALDKGKAVLAGADVSLLQTKPAESRKFMGVP
jgi:septal ring factor EnvC (AmiA/AmiB activator)